MLSTASRLNGVSESITDLMSDMLSAYTRLGEFKSETLHANQGKFSRASPGTDDLTRWTGCNDEGHVLHEGQL